MADTIPKFVYNSITVELEYPLYQNNPWRTNAIRTDDYSRSGRKQTLIDYLEEVKVIDIQFMSESLTDSLRTMWDDWASEGKSFYFYPDKDSATYYTVTITDKSFTPERQKIGMDKYKIKFTIRKEVT